MGGVNSVQRRPLVLVCITMYSVVREASVQRLAAESMTLSTGLVRNRTSRIFALQLPTRHFQPSFGVAYNVLPATLISAPIR